MENFEKELLLPANNSLNLALCVRSSLRSEAANAKWTFPAAARFTLKAFHFEPQQGFYRENAEATRRIGAEWFLIKSGLNNESACVFSWWQLKANIAEIL